MDRDWPVMPTQGEQLGQIFAVDLGGSKVLTGLVERSGRFFEVERFVPGEGGIDLILEEIESRYHALKASFPLDGCGVTVPGLADPVTGIWKHASFSGVGNLPLRDLLEKRLGLPVAIANDVDACASAEQRWGGGRAFRNFAWITLSNGVGGALVLNGELYRGEGCAAGEIGHMKAVRGGRACECGGCGCLEQYASGRAIAHDYRNRAGVEGPCSAEDVADLCRMDDPHARAAFDYAGQQLGIVLSDVVSLLNLPVIFFGGGVAQSFELLRPAVVAALEANLYAEANGVPELKVTELGYHAALLGAASIFISQEKEANEDLY